MKRSTGLTAQRPTCESPTGIYPLSLRLLVAQQVLRILGLLRSTPATFRSWCWPALPGAAVLYKHWAAGVQDSHPCSAGHTCINVP